MRILCTAIIILLVSSSLAQGGVPCLAAQADNATTAGCIVLTLDGVDSLKRPVIQFNHEKHVTELGENNCRTCHADNQDGGLIFTFPKNPPETDNEEDLMNAWHNACITCHTERDQEAKKTGPLTCGQCHIRESEHSAAEHVPILPSYYEPLRDSHHGECLNCHSEPALKAQDAPVLDWKQFQVLRGTAPESQISPSGFDYQRHALHSKTLEEDCGLCHYLAPQKQQALKKEDREPECRDWLLDPDPEGTWREEDYAHARCVNCHFKRTEAGEEKTGPLQCSTCHAQSQRTPEQMKDIPRSDCQQDAKILIRAKDSMVMEAVPFNHAAHQQRTNSCQECHHKNISSCDECHTVNGDEKAEFVTLAQAFHRESSSRSCVGCHETQKQKPECAGCHQQLPSSITADSCATCHNGNLSALEHKRETKHPKDLIAPDVKETWQIEKLGETYKKVQFNHLAITQALADVSNASPLASYFHTDDMALCAGCHHYSPLEPEKPMPACITCHDKNVTTASRRPDLMGAYHQQCLGCHRQTAAPEEKMPQTCDGCHANKTQ